MYAQNRKVFLWQAIRFVVVYLLVKKFKVRLRTIKSTYLSSFLALLCGGVLSKVIDTLFEQFYCKLYGLEPLQVLDNMFLYDTQKKPAIAIVVWETTKFDYEDYRPKLVKRYERDLPRNRSKLVMAFGRNYFMKMSD